MFSSSLGGGTHLVVRLDAALILILGGDANAGLLELFVVGSYGGCGAGPHAFCSNQGNTFTSECV